MEPEEWKIFKPKGTYQKFTWGKALAAQKMLNIDGLANFLKSDNVDAVLKQGYKFFGVRLESVVGTMKKYVDIEEPTGVFIMNMDNKYGDFAVFYKPKTTNSKSK